MNPTITSLLQRYDEQHDLLLLRTAGEALDRIDLFAAPGAQARGDARLAALQGWLMVLARLDAASDSGFDPAHAPAMKLAPVSPAGGPVYPPGIDPSAVREPQIRADYERALAANQRERERAARYWNWSAVDIELSDRARRFVGRFYTASNADQVELAGAIEQAGLSPSRRKRLTLP